MSIQSDRKNPVLEEMRRCPRWYIPSAQRRLGTESRLAAPLWGEADEAVSAQTHWEWWAERLSLSF